MEKANLVTLLLGVGFGISEALAMIPEVKSNSVFQAVYNTLKALSGNSEKNDDE